MAREPITDEQVPGYGWVGGSQGVFFWWEKILTQWEAKEPKKSPNVFVECTGLRFSSMPVNPQILWANDGCICSVKGEEGERWWKGAPKRPETGRKSQETLLPSFLSQDPQFQPKIFLDPHFADFRCKSMQCFTAISRRKNTSVVVVWSRRFVRGSHAAELMDWWKMMKVRYKVKEDQVTITFIWLLQCMQNEWSIIAQLLDLLEELFQVSRVALLLWIDSVAMWTSVGFGRVYFWQGVLLRCRHILCKEHAQQWLGLPAHGQHTKMGVTPYFFHGILNLPPPLCSPPPQNIYIYINNEASIRPYPVPKPMSPML